MSVKVFPVNDKEGIEKCLEIRREVFVREKGIPADVEADGLDFSADFSHFIALFDGASAGALRCRPSGGELVIQRFCVVKKYRMAGVGREMLRFVEDYYKSRGVRSVSLDSKYAVCAFYEKCGYKKVSSVFTEAGVPHIKMLKTL